MVSSVGETAVSGLSIVDTINILFINIFAALATGGAVLTSQYLGNRDQKSANLSAKQLILSTAFLATIIMCVVLFASSGILRLVFGHVDHAVMETALIYFKISACLIRLLHYIIQVQLYFVLWEIQKYL
ncbi:MAG: MATE family efflux transporter [Longicatena sp.]